MTVLPARTGLGPQHEGDNAWTARMRLHQSWYRASVLGLPFGTGPSKGDARLLGSMLDEHGAAAGANFIDPAVRLVYAQHSKQGVEAFRCERNMLSSQPMCFNLFGPLALDTALATRLMQAVLPDEIAVVEEVRIEFAPEPRQQYLDNRTSFDALVRYRTPDGHPAFLGIETKLTEPFTQRAGAKHHVYEALSRREDSIWRQSDWDRLADPRWRQLWQNHLLVEALRRHPAAPFGQRGLLVLVSHPSDERCARTSAAYSTTLVSSEETFVDLPVDALLPAWREAVSTDAERRWLFELTRRYLHLAGSEHLVPLCR